MDPDPALPQVATLLGPEARSLLATALEPAGAQVLHARPTQVRYEPGRRVTVRYATTVRDPAGRERVDTVVATARRGDLPHGVAVLEDGAGRRVGIWRYPYDPALPGLRSLVRPDGVRHVLRQVGVEAERVGVSPVVYRPEQRAVLRVSAGDATLFAKVLPPERAGTVQRAHRALSGHGPVPRSLGWSRSHGVVVLEALGGDRLTDRLSGQGPLPPPEALLEALDGIAAVDPPGASPPTSAATGAHGAGRTGRDAAATVAGHARLLKAVSPGERATIEALQSHASGVAQAADRTIHGDFYEGQVLVRGRRVTGLLDVDGVRRGSLTEDVATLVGHLEGLALVRPSAAARIEAYRHCVERCVAGRLDPQELRRAVAGVLLGLATGPFRLQQRDWPAWTARWLALARRWLPEHEQALTATSSAPHPAGTA